MLLRCWDLWDRVLRYMWLRCWDLWDRVLRYMLLRCWDLWVRLLRYMLLRCWDLCWGGVGWGGVGGDVNVPCTSYMIHCYAAEISGIVYYVTCCYAAEISVGVVWGADCQLFTTHALQRWRWKKAKTRRNFFQAFQSSNWHGTVVKSPFCKAMTLKKEKNAPQVFPGVPIIKLARHCGKITIFKKNVRFMGTVSGPAGCLWQPGFPPMSKKDWWMNGWINGMEWLECIQKKRERKI